MRKEEALINIPVWLSSSLLVDSWVVFSFCLLQIKPPWTSTSLHMDMFLLLVCKIQQWNGAGGRRVQVSGWVDVSLVRNCRTVFPPDVPVSRLRAFQGLHGLVSTWCDCSVTVAPAVDVSQCRPGLDVRVPNTNAEMPNIFSCVRLPFVYLWWSVQSCAPLFFFFNWVVCFLIIESWKFYICSG